MLFHLFGYYYVCCVHIIRDYYIYAYLFMRMDIIFAIIAINTIIINITIIMFVKVL